MTEKHSKEKDKYLQLLHEMGDGKIGKEISCLINSRHKLIYVTTNEERRVLDCFKFASAANDFKLFQWDISRGMLDVDSSKQVVSSNNEVHSIPEAAIAWCVEQAREDNKAIQNKKQESHTGYIYLFLDIHHFMRDHGSPTIERLLKEFAGIPSVCCIVIISHAFICPPGLQSEMTVLDFPYPSRKELKRSLNTIVKEIPIQLPLASEFALSREDDLLNSVTGLTLTEAENAFAKTLVKHRNFDIPTILEEKKQMIRKNGIVEYRDPRFKFDDIGGLYTLKKWLQLRKEGFSQEASAFGLDLPKGVLILGVPGTGKSMTCDAVASYYEMPLLRLDIGAIFSSLVGESEQNIRNALKVASSVSPCVLWIDEIEKGIGGVKSSNMTDSGVTSRIFGTLLTWMQEKTTPVFTVCTANNVLDIPPEFMRAGRFDEIFFVDLPDTEQREEVVEKLLRRKNRDTSKFNTHSIALATENYSPAEIEKGINNALFLSFSEGRRDLTEEDIVSEVGKFQPLYNSRREEINNMRAWALGEDGNGGRAVLANSKTTEKDFAVKPTGRKVCLVDPLTEYDL